MAQLNSQALPTIAPKAQVPSYDRATIEAGIVHFGVGNFHRTHQAVYCDDLLNKGETQWGITGVSMRSPTMRDKLKNQDYLYTTLSLGEATNCRIIGAIKTILVAPETPSAVISTVASNTTKVVTTTITEKGYCLAFGEIDTNHPDFNNDNTLLTQPQTIYGYLAAALIARANANGQPLTIICCDNIQGGGEHLSHGVSTLLKKHSPETQEWVAQNIAFTSSMVDRVSPATDDQLCKTVASLLGANDQSPVSAEPFSQWIIQDNFAGPRPPFDQAGAQFVADITPYETMKLRFLNAGHSMISSIGYLSKASAIHEALDEPAILDFVTQALVKNVLPITPIPADSDGLNYIQQVLSRFQNGALPYAILQVGTDSSQKIQQRWFPSIDDALHQKAATSYLAFSLATWVHYIMEALQNEDLNDPLANEFAAALPTATDAPANAFLALAGAEKFHFFTQPDFLTSVNAYFQGIAELGINTSLNAFLGATGENH